MQQVLFTIPILKDQFPPDGIPIHGFGAMLFLALVVCVLWGMRRAKPTGMPPERFQDMILWIVVAGLVGARVLYMIQYSHQFPDKSPGGLFREFFSIWKGGIIFYGSALGGALGYGLFYWFVLRKMPVSRWQLADAVAPILALGLAVGRIGCYLNGCCWGQVAVEEACPVPLGGAHFPLLPAHARDQLVRDPGLQTSTGFTVAPRDRSFPGADPRTVVQAVERGSAADRAGLQPGDKIVGLDGRPNKLLVEVLGTGEPRAKALDELGKHGGQVEEGSAERVARVAFEKEQDYVQAVEVTARLVPGVTLVGSDSLGELVQDWPRGKHELALVVQRGDKEEALPAFVPRTISLYPTQLYETVSMILLIFLLLAYYPFRRHDGQLFVLCMVGYAVHRFINESIRIEPTVGLGLTLSQWGSVVILALALGIEAYLWRVMPSRWAATPPKEPPPTAAPVAGAKA
jgi:prolipoprotein diacylglyceryltransferase